MPVTIVPKRELKALLKQLEKVGEVIVQVPTSDKLVVVIWKGHETAVDDTVYETR